MSKAESIAVLETFSSAVSDLAARAASSLVAIHSHRSRSSGFTWRPGLIGTADEALADEGEISVTLPGGESLPATLAGRDPSTDIALLRVDRANLQPAWLGPVTAAAGVLAIVVGSQDGSPTAALGVVSFAGGRWRVCGAERSITALNWTPPCVDRTRVGLPSMRRGALLGWRCSVHGGACW